MSTINVRELHLAGQRAIITGANSGIGEGVARGLAAAGVAVAVNYVAGEDKARQIVDDIRASGGKAIMVKADVSKEADVKAMFAHAVDSFGSIDILVNNAGLQQDAPFQEMTLQQWDKVIAVNLTGQFLCAREAARGGEDYLHLFRARCHSVGGSR
jgi:glucose 1-dehydrogenase